MLKSYNIEAYLVKYGHRFPAVNFFSVYFRSFETSWLVILVFTRRIPFPFSSSVYQTKSVLKSFKSRSNFVLFPFQSRPF